MTLKRTILYEEHKKLGAKLVEFAGFEMPVQYKGISLEHQAVRNHAGLFDVSHMGEFIVKGAGALLLIQYLTTNNAANLKEGQVQYSCLTNENGNVLDDLLVYCLDPHTYMLVVNASNIEKDWNWLVKQNENCLQEKIYQKGEVEVKDISSRTALLALQGPKAIDILQSLTSDDLKGIRYYSFIRGEIAGIKNVIISATGYTGSGGFELYFDIENARKIWNSILEKGIPFGLEPAGLGARDTLRLEMGFCLYGHELNAETNPLEAGLSWITKLNTNFIGSTSLEEYKKNGLQKKLIGFIMEGSAIPRPTYPIKNKEGEVIGEVCSGTQSPSLKKGIGMGYIQIKDRDNQEKQGNSINLVHSNHQAAGLLNQNNPDPIYIEIRGNLFPATIVQTPFYKS